MEQQQFAQLIEQTYKEALAAADAIRESAAAERAALADELAAAKKARENAEAEGREAAAAFFDIHRKELEEKVRSEWLHRLVTRHLKAGAAPEEIIRWLDAPAEMVARIETQMAVRRQQEGGARVEFVDQGRGGSIFYVKGKLRVLFGWEFATGRSFMHIDVPRESEWEKSTGLPLSERMAVLELLAQAVCNAQLTSKGYVIHDAHIEILKGDLV